MKLSPLKNLLLLDAAILIVIGGLFIVAPRQITAFFKFTEVPAAINYLIGLWGCVLITLGAAYVIAASNPVRHRLWIQIGIARGALETLLGLAYLAIGSVTFAQAGFGTIAAAVMTVAYLLLYPRRPRVVESPPTNSPAP
jgi:hypothetical protein